MFMMSYKIQVAQTAWDSCEDRLTAHRNRLRVSFKRKGQVIGFYQILDFRSSKGTMKAIKSHGLEKVFSKHKFSKRLTSQMC